MPANRRNAFAALFGALALPRAAFAQAADPEREYWLRQAALLDPAAYEICTGSGWSQTVPNGEQWEIVACGSLCYPSLCPGKRIGFVRTFSVGETLSLPSGTTFGAAPNRTAAAYICKPASVAGNTRYTDPKALYYERLARLRTLPLRVAYAEIANNAPHGAASSATLPDDFENGWIVGASAYGVSWLTLSGWNLMPEVSNDHSVRFARGGGAPFNRAAMGTFIVKGGSLAGDTVSPCMSGSGSFYYQALPLDW